MLSEGTSPDPPSGASFPAIILNTNRVSVIHMTGNSKIKIPGLPDEGCLSGTILTQHYEDFGIRELATLNLQTKPPLLIAVVNTRSKNFAPLAGNSP